MARKLTPVQAVVMNWLSKGWKAYVARGTRVEVNGHPVGTTATMATLEKLGLVEKLGVAAWEATEAGKQWTAPKAAEPG